MGQAGFRKLHASYGYATVLQTVVFGQVTDLTQFPFYDPICCKKAKPLFLHGKSMHL